MIALYSEKTAKSKLEKLCPLPMYLTWHENRTSYLSYRKERGKVHLRLHRLFLSAPTPVFEAIMGMALNGDQNSAKVVRKMAHLYFSNTRVPSQPLLEKGAFYDLAKIRDQIKERYFPSIPLNVPIGWSKQKKVGRFRCITFGSYDSHRHQIRINPCLDDQEVPRYFVEYIVYHEMLHAIYPPKIDERGRVRSHPPEFRRLEKNFDRFHKAKLWEKGALKFFKQKGHRGRS